MDLFLTSLLYSCQRTYYTHQVKTLCTHAGSLTKGAAQQHSGLIEPLGEVVGALRMSDRLRAKITGNNNSDVIDPRS